MIKVLHTEWSDGWGGQEIRVINEMTAMRELGVEVFLACREKSLIKKYAIKKGIEVFELPFKGNIDIITFLKLRKIIKKFQIDIVNTHSGKDTWVGGLAAKSSNIKFIRTRHLSNLINPSRLNFINEIADYVITTGESVKSDMIKYNRIDPKKIMSIPTGVDPGIFNPSLYKKKSIRTKLNIDDETIVIGIVAVLRDSKRHDIFLELARYAKNTYKNFSFKFLVVGEGPMRENVTEVIKHLDLENEVIMLGHREDIPELLRAMDIFLFTADRREGVPQSLMQALLMNIPSVSTNDGSTNDLFYENNFLISNPGYENIRKNLDIQIERIINKFPHKPSRDYISENFSKKSAANKILSIYRQITQ